MIDRILRLNGLFFTEIWTNNVTVTFYCFYLRKGTWRFHLYDGNYKITVLLGTAQARGGGGGGVTFAYYWWGCRILPSLPDSRFCLVTHNEEAQNPYPVAHASPRPPHGWDLLVIGKIQWLFFDLYPKSFTGACGLLHPYVWGSGRKVG